MAKLTLLDLTEAKSAIKMDCTLANPSADFVQALIGFPTAAGKPVTRDTAVRVASFLSGVKILANDIAKMPLVLRSRTVNGDRVRTQPALSNPLYSLLAHVPNKWQTSFQLRWFLASQLIMNSNAFCQIIRDQTGKVLALNPLNAWQMSQKWDLTDPKNPKIYWVYSDLYGNLRTFQQEELWHATSLNLEASGMFGSAVVALAKEALSVLMAAEETAGRNFANGLGMGGFITSPPEVQITEPEAQNVVDTLKKNFSGSQNAGKFSLLPGGLKWEKMTFNAQESQLLESRKWNAEEVIRLLGGAPLLVKLGMGGVNSTYASSSAFLEDYFQTALMPHCVAFEQSIMRDLIDPKDRNNLYAKHDAGVILRGSLRERAETYEIQIRSGQMSPNEVRVDEDRDTVDGLDWYCLPANTAIYHDGEIYIPGQDLPGKETPAEDAADTKPETPAEDKAENPAAKKATARLLTVANSLAERVERKEAKGNLDAKFVSEVLACSPQDADAYIRGRKDGTISDEGQRAELVRLATAE